MSDKELRVLYPLARVQGSKGRVAGRGQGETGASTHRPLESCEGCRVGVTGSANIWKKKKKAGKERGTRNVRRGYSDNQRSLWLLG